MMARTEEQPGVDLDQITDQDLDMILVFAERRVALMKQMKAALEQGEEGEALKIARRIFGIPGPQGEQKQ
jgi:hypothetical protein